MNWRWFADGLVCSAIAAALAVPSGRAQDVQAVIKDAENALGMIRGVARIDGINTMEYWGTGSEHAVLQPENSKPQAAQAGLNYHASLSYAVPAMRVETSGTNSDKPSRQIQVVNGRFAWNESEPGAGFIPGTTATPAPLALNLRLLQLWTTPFGALKAAVKAGAKAKVTTEAGATVITFPLPDPLSSVTAKVTLNANKQVARVETRGGGAIDAETLYAEYKDISIVPTDVLFPTHIVQKVGGSAELDLTIAKTDTNNPYVVFPVPENVEKGARP